MSAGRPGKGSRRTALVLAGIAAGMVGVAFAAVPLYDLFCRTTGYGGTVRQTTESPIAVSQRLITVRFNADTQSALPWRFRPAQRQMPLHLGETGLAIFVAENRGETAIVGTATFNVTPQVAGSYFNKIDCFCFEEQVLRSGESAELPVQFFVDPALAEDPDTAHIRTITLSYTFFDAGPEAAARHAEAADVAPVPATSLN